ncbi:phage portal protein [Ferrovum sp.]|uniref:phage portal protein n=1 Tax=Ferrovum sp. TaxID=2609467 RepID=UPI00261677C5|nr:phage portal protein [Ferrovum sp.]
MGIRSWLSSFKANSDRSPWSGFWFEPVGVQTMAGMRVTADNALQLSAVFACVRIISSQFASLPFVLYRTRRDGGKKRVTDHPLYPLLARRPNPYQNAFEWREMLAGHLVLRGNAFNQIVSNRQGEITALVPLHPDRVTIDLLPNGDYRYKYTTMTGSEQIFPRGQIWHLRGLSLDGIIGLSPIALARNAIGGAMAAQNYGSRFFANDAKPLSGYVEYPGSFKDKMAREQFRESLQESQTGANRGKIAVFEFGMKYHQLGLTNEDAQFLETRKFQVNDIARWFGVPPHKIGDLERSTNNNIEQQAQEFVQECLGPMAERWEASIEAELLFDDDGLEAEFLFSQLLRGDSQARAQYYNLGINGGWLTRNEARLSENLNPLPGLDRPLRPLNMAEEQNDGSDPTQPPTADNIDKPVPPLKNNSEESHETRALDV